MESADGSRFHFCGNTSTSVLPVPGISAYNLLRNYNYLLSSQTPDLPSKTLQSSIIPPALPIQATTLNEDVPQMACLDSEKSYLNILPAKPPSLPSLFGYQHHFQMLQNDEISMRSNKLAPAYPLPYSACFKRQRGEKKPIPEDLKDEKYFERRRRNNHAAKKSRDARKMREDQIAFRATLLEHENALLRAQLLTVREEASSLRQMLLQKKALELVNRESQLCTN